MASNRISRIILVIFVVCHSLLSAEKLYRVDTGHSSKPSSASYSTHTLTPAVSPQPPPQTGSYSQFTDRRPKHHTERDKPWDSHESAAGGQQEPLVLLVMLVRNKQLYLPFVLSRLLALDYPKHRMALFLRCDHNEDRSAEVLAAWLRVHAHSYHSVDCRLDVVATVGNDSAGGGGGGGGGGERCGAMDGTCDVCSVSDICTVSGCDSVHHNNRDDASEDRDDASEDRAAAGGARWPDESGAAHLSPARYRHVIALKQSALQLGRRVGVDYVWFVDADVLWFRDDLLRYLMARRRPLVAPMLTSATAYANFWAATTGTHYYRRVPRYFHLLERQTVGCHQVPMIHSCVLVDLRAAASARLTFARDRLAPSEGPLDDVITLAISARQAGLHMTVCNERYDGVVPVPLDEHDPLGKDRWNFQYSLLEAIVEDVNLTVDCSLSRYLPAGSPFAPSTDCSCRCCHCSSGCSSSSAGTCSRPGAPPTAPHHQPSVRSPPVTQSGGASQSVLLDIADVFIINLQRRPDRLRRMLAAMHVLGVPNAQLVAAVDGRQLRAEQLRSGGVRPLADYEDPYWRRPLTLGEIGCFLSHYQVWRRVASAAGGSSNSSVSSGSSSSSDGSSSGSGSSRAYTLVLEDDVRFGAHFVPHVRRLVRELRQLPSDCELVYLGRKVMSGGAAGAEPRVRGTRWLLRPHYTYWTLAYLVSPRGAAKLLAARPLGKLVPVDEFLPIMFDRHPNSTWRHSFDGRSLRACSATPLLVQPMRYSRQPGYVSDTESSQLLPATAD